MSGSDTSAGDTTDGERGASRNASARIVWTEIFDLASDNAFVVLDEIGNRIVASIASEESKPSNGIGPS